MGASLQKNEALDENPKTKLAWLKLSGYEDTEKDPESAVELLEQSVKEGDVEAMWMLGLCCEYGIGIKQNVERAELLYRQSSEARNVTGTFLEWNSKGGSGVVFLKSLRYDITFCTLF